MLNELWALHDSSGLRLRLSDRLADPLDQPIVAPTPTPTLSAEDRRGLQSFLISQLPILTVTDIISVFSAQEMQAIRTQMRAAIGRNFDDAVALVRRHGMTAANQIPFPPTITPLTAEQIRQIREFDRNNQPNQLATFRNQIIDARVEEQLHAELRRRIGNTLTSEQAGNQFGPLTRLVYNRVAPLVQRQLIATLQEFIERGMAFPVGCPVEPPVNPISGRRVSDEVFRAMLRNWRPNQPTNDVNFNFPILDANALPTPQHVNQLLRADAWLHIANQQLFPIRQEGERRALSELITQVNRPGWARDRYPNAGQWEARAQALVDLELQMRACAATIVRIHNRFDSFSLHGLQGGNPPFPGQIQLTSTTPTDNRTGLQLLNMPAPLPQFSIQNIRPDLPDSLDLTPENVERIERCVAWLRHHGGRVNNLLERLYSGNIQDPQTGNTPNILMLGNHEPGERRNLQGQVTPNEINGHSYNLVTFDFTVQRTQNGQYTVRPEIRYRNSPFYNYRNLLVDGTVHVQPGQIQTLNAGDLVLVNREGRFVLLPVEQLANWRNAHNREAAVHDAIAITIDASMLLSGVAEAGAAWKAASLIALREGTTAGTRTLWFRAVQSGGLNFFWAGSSLVSSAYWGDRNVLGGWGPAIRTGRDYAMLIDNILQMRDIHGFGVLGRPRALASEMDRAISSSLWLRGFHRAGELDLPGLLISNRLSTGRVMQPLLLGSVIGYDTWRMVMQPRPESGLNLTSLSGDRHRIPIIDPLLRDPLSISNMDRILMGRLSTLVTDNRTGQHPLQRRHNVEQQLITEFNRNGATEQERLLVAALLLREAAMNTAGGVVPEQLGEQNGGVSSQTIRDYINARRNSQNPETRRLAFEAALNTIVLDNRVPQQPPQRRQAVEQRLIAEFNRTGATEQERVTVATLLLIEAGRNIVDGTIPAQLGANPTTLASQELRTFLNARYRNSSNPEIRLQAAQGMLAVGDIDAQQFATVCKSIATNNDLPRDVRAKAILGLSVCMMIAGVAEPEMVRNVSEQQASRNDGFFHLIHSFGVTRHDLESCLRSIATNSTSDRDLRALCAAALHAGESGDFRQSIQALHSLANNWHQSRQQPPGSFATTLVSSWARDISQQLIGTEPPQVFRRVFSAASALRLLSDPAFQPIWQAQDASLAASILTGNTDLTQVGALANVRPRLTPQLLDDTLIACINSSDSEVAVRAVLDLLPRLSALTDDQTNAFRAAVINLLSELRRPNQRYHGSPNITLPFDALTNLTRQPGLNLNGLDLALAQQSARQEELRTLYRQRIFGILPQLFANASEQQFRSLMGQLGDAVNPRSQEEIRLSTPLLRSAAATAIGRLLTGRSIARNYTGNHNTSVMTDSIQALVRQPHFLSMANLNQQLLQQDTSLLSRLEAATHDPSPLVRRAAIEALFLARPLRLSNGRTFQAFCTDLLSTETDPAVLAALRRAEFLERSPDPTSADYIADFQRARNDLLFSLNCRGARSLAGIPNWILANCATTETLPGTNNRPPYNQPYHILNRTALRTSAIGTGETASNALKALVYIIVSQGRPFERGQQQTDALDGAVSIMREVCERLNPGADAQRTSDVLWALELCLVLNPNLLPRHRTSLLEDYGRLLERVPLNPSLRHRAAIVAALVLEREFVTSNSVTANAALQSACLRLLNTYRTRAAIPILELIVRTNRNAPITAEARTLLQQLTSDPDLHTPGTLGGPLRNSVAFDEAYETLWRQLITSNDSIYLRPGIRPLAVQIAVDGQHQQALPMAQENGPNTTNRTILLRRFANAEWFWDFDVREYATNVWHILHDAHTVGQNHNPAAAFQNLLDLARRNGARPNRTPNQQATELRVQSQARLALAWIVAVNGEGLVHSHRDEFVRRAAETLARITEDRLDGLADLDSVIESTLVGQPLMSQDRQVRNHMITALWNRRQSNNGSISNSRAALILAGALRSEFQTMPRPGEPGFDTSRDMQMRLLEYLQQIGDRVSTPVVEALAMHHPIPLVRARAEQTLIALHDNVWRIWSQTASDNVTTPNLRANALRTALDTDGAHNATVQAVLSAYRGCPVVAGDPRYQLYLRGLSDHRAHVRLASALVALRSENTAFTDVDKERARTICAHLALHGLHIGLRQSARSILMDNLPNSLYRVQPVTGTDITMVKTANSFTMFETVNGRITSVLLNDGRIRRLFYDEQNRLTRYISEDNTEYTVIQRNGAQLTWSNGRGLQFVSPDQPVTIDGALSRGIQLQISRVTYPDGFFREFRHDGDTLAYLNENGTEYERMRDGNSYTDVWRINGSNTNLWYGPMSVSFDGVFTEFRHSYNANRIVDVYGNSRYQSTTQVIRLGDWREWTVHADGRNVITAFRGHPNLTLNLGQNYQLQQFDHGGSILRYNNRITLVSYPPGSNPPFRRFEYNNAGHITRMIFQHNGAEVTATRIFNAQGQPTRQYRITGGGFDNLYNGALTISNGHYEWDGDDGYRQVQRFDTGEYSHGRFRPDD